MATTAMAIVFHVEFKKNHIKKNINNICICRLLDKKTTFNYFV